MAGTGRRAWPTAPGAAADVIAALSAGLVLALFAVCAVLSYLTRDLPATFSGVLPVAALVFAALGVVITRASHARRPGRRHAQL